MNPKPQDHLEILSYLNKNKSLDLVSIQTALEVGLYSDQDKPKEAKHMFVRTKNGDSIKTYRIKLVLIDHDSSQGISFTQ